MIVLVCLHTGHLFVFVSLFTHFLHTHICPQLQNITLDIESIHITHSSLLNVFLSIATHTGLGFQNSEFNILVKIGHSPSF